ncbi:MAG TPA: tetratricopeptide repeat protein [Candidatus Paceibacterota bacterium]|nr:tetratricopeptide repeat protein [Verrucomicrobiota bacterium]HSA11559.1 tetratricopeptide repeat protein [Candidatus Paceibacterota bacterium]
MKTTNLVTKLARRTGATLLLLSLANPLPTALAAAAPSPAELLEQGLYSEQTKGDIDEAMKLYQQVVAEGKAGQAVAAQAQYRLGMCFHKKKNYAEATAAFERVVRDYPEQRDLVALASRYLTGATPLLRAPWVEGEEMQLDIKFPTGFKLGTVVYRINAGETNGQKLWRVSSRLFATTQQASRVEAEAETFKPLRAWWKVDLMGETEVAYSDGQAEVRIAGKDGIKKVNLAGVVYDNEEAAQLIRRLPLRSGYKTTLRIFSGLGGGNIIPLGVKVAGEEKVKVPAGEFDCYKIELTPVNQTFYYSADAHRYLVKFEAGGVVAELAQVTQRKAGEPVAYKDAELGFGLTAPAEWVFHAAETDDEKDTTRVVVLDPDAVAMIAVNVGSREIHGPKAGQSLREWAEKEVIAGEAVKTLKALKIRPESWQERTVAGQAGMSVVGDFMDKKEKKVGYAVFVPGKANTAVMTLIVPEKDFEGCKPAFEAVVDSYREKRG